MLSPLGLAHRPQLLDLALQLGDLFLEIQEMPHDRGASITARPVPPGWRALRASKASGSFVEKKNQKTFVPLDTR